MYFLVKDHTTKGKVFATLAEASAYREELIRTTRRVYTIVETKRKPTHIYIVD